jgi:hypothetical protein
MRPAAAGLLGGQLTAAAPRLPRTPAPPHHLTNGWIDACKENWAARRASCYSCDFPHRDSPMNARCSANFLAAGLSLCVSLPLWAHPHDPAYVRLASDRLLRALESPEGARSLDRISRRLGDLNFCSLGAIDRDEAIRVALEVVPRPSSEGGEGRS